MKKTKSPNFFIVGPPKCATTSLYYYLKQHPAVYLSEQKETRFFDLNYSKGIDYFESTYFLELKDEKAIGEATVTYSFLPFAADRLKKHYPNAKLIFSYRDPVERAYSEWLMRVSAGIEPLSFRDAILANQNQSPIDFETRKGANLWEKRYENIRTKYVQDFRVYIESSLFGRQLEYYSKLFPSNQILIVSVDDLNQNPQHTLKNIFKFLNIDENITVNSFEVRNPYSYKKKMSTLLYSSIGVNASKRLWKVIPKSLQKNIATFLNNKKLNKPRLSSEDRTFAEKIFKEDQQLFKTFLN